MTLAGLTSALTRFAIRHHFARDLAADVGDFAFEIAHARFMGVVADDVVQAFVGEFDVFFRPDRWLRAAW